VKSVCYSLFYPKECGTAPIAPSRVWLQVNTALMVLETTQRTQKLQWWVHEEEHMSFQTGRCIRWHISIYNCWILYNHEANHKGI
jgi:hypothetical protein